MFHILTFLLAIVAANLSVAYFGPASTPFNAFILIGLDLSLRDCIHERWRRHKLGLKMMGLIIAGGVITWVLNHGTRQICIASVTAFAASLSMDTLIYEKLFHHRPIVKMNASNVIAAAVDSFLFPTIAFGKFMPGIIFLQFIAKSFGGALWTWLLTTNNKAFYGYFVRKYRWIMSRT